jgi:hypothetical protein
MKKAFVSFLSLAVIVGVTLVCLQAAAAAEKKEGGKKEKKESGLPPGAKGFAGMIQGKVTAKTDGGGVVLAVESIAKVWKHSKAKEPKSMVGKKVRVVAPTEGKHAENIVRFLKGVKVDDEITVDVANKKGDTLTLLELTKEQREKIEKEEK